MEDIHIRDDNSSPPATAGLATSLDQADPLLLTPNRREAGVEDPAPSPASVQYADKARFPKFKLPRSKPLFRCCERPSISRITTLTALCFITYPAFCILTSVAKDKSFNDSDFFILLSVLLP